MKRSKHTYVPIAFAILVTGAVGAFMKLKTTEDIRPDKVPRGTIRPKEIKVEILRSGTGRIPGYKAVQHPGMPIAEVPDTAAWMSFQSTADGKLRKPNVSDALLSFYAVDDKGHNWPVVIDKTPTQAYAYIVGPNAVAPKELYLECQYGDQQIGRWKMPALPKPKRIFSAADAKRDLNKDFPELRAKPHVLITPGSTSASISLSLNQKRTGETWMGAWMVAHSFGKIDYGGRPDGSFQVPIAYLKELDAVEVEVHRAAIKHHKKTVRISNGNIGMKEGLPRVVIDPVGPIELQPGFEVSLEPKWFVFKSGISARPIGQTREHLSVENIEVAGYETAELVNNQTGERMFEIVPQKGQTKFRPLDVTIYYLTARELPKLKYILPLPKPVSTPPARPRAQAL